MSAKREMPSTSVPAPESVAPPTIVTQSQKLTVPSAPTSLLQASLAPRVVVVNPTPHPTPPATPLVGPAAVRDGDAERPISPVPALPPTHLSTPLTVHVPAEAVLQTNTRRSGDRPADLQALSLNVGTSSRFFLPPTSPVDDSGSSEGSVLALLATPEDRRPPPSPLSDLLHRGPGRSELGRQPSSDPQPGTSAVSQTSITSRVSSNAAQRRGHAAGKRPAAALRRSHTAQIPHARPSAARKGSGGGKAGKTSLAAGAIRRSSSTANTAADPTGLRALTANVPPVGGPPSAKSTKGKVPPSPVVKAGARGKAKAKKFVTRGLSRTKSIVKSPQEDTEEEDSEGEEAAVPEGEGNDEDEGWDDVSPEEVAAQQREQRRLDQEEARRLAEEAEKKRIADMFRRREPHEYANLGRTQSTGLLTQLLNPDPMIFPPTHPYRLRMSTDNLSNLPKAQQQKAQEYRRSQSTLGSRLAPMTAIGPAAARPVAPSPLAPMQRSSTAAPVASGTRTPTISRTPSLAAGRSFAPSLKLTKSTAALPAMDAMTAQAGPGSSVAYGQAKIAMAVATAGIRPGKEKSSTTSITSTQPVVATPTHSSPGVIGSPSSSAQRSRGVPEGVELETDSEDESSPENGIQVARSVVQQKLAAFGRRHTPKAPAPSPASPHNAPPAPPSAALLRQLPQKPPRQRSEPYMQDAPVTQAGLPNNYSSNGLAGIGGRTTAPIPVNHPYNLPLAPPPASPRTQRRMMVQTELSESLRRGLLHEHRVNRQPIPRRQGILGAGGDLRSLTPVSRQEVEEERQRRARLDRQRSMVDEFRAQGL
jgi:hypothetical protein